MIIREVDSERGRGYTWACKHEALYLEQHEKGKEESILGVGDEGMFGTFLISYWSCIVIFEMLK